MKNLRLLLWLTQLGMNVALPLGGFIWLSVWLHDRFDWGVWVIAAGTVLGIVCGVNGFCTALRAMERLAQEKQEDTPPACFHDRD